MRTTLKAWLELGDAPTTLTWLQNHVQVVGLFGDSKHPGMVYHSRPEDDPYITQQGDSDSDKGDFVLKGTDRLILAARNEDDVSHLEVQRSSFRSCQLHVDSR